jgi:hypothetical protein
VRFIWEKIKREPAVLLSLVGAAFALASAFGFDLSKEQTGAITAFIVVVLGIVTRQSVTPNASVAAKEANPPADETFVAGPAADVPNDEVVEVVPAEHRPLSEDAHNGL